MQKLELWKTNLCLYLDSFPKHTDFSDETRVMLMSVIFI